MALLESLGLFSGFTGLTIIVARPFVAEWIRARIASGVEEAVRRRLATFQLDLDKDLEAHRSGLALEAERVRAVLARTSTDYAIYAARRHDAIAALFAEFLQAESLATTLPPVPAGQRGPSNDQLMWPRVFEARERAYAAYATHVLYLPTSLDSVALAARGAFHDVLDEYASPENDGRPAHARMLRELRLALQAFQDGARTELARSAADVESGARTS